MKKTYVIKNIEEIPCQNSCRRLKPKKTGFLSTLNPVKTHFRVILTKKVNIDPFLLKHEKVGTTFT